MSIATRRHTEYVDMVRRCLNNLRHASNSEILSFCRATYPQLSATTVHRITSRMISDGEIGLAPPTHDLAKRFDLNLLPHSHFICRECDHLSDLHLSEETIQSLKSRNRLKSTDFQISVHGKCERCIIEDKQGGL